MEVELTFFSIVSEKPEIARKSPVKINLKNDENYEWCSCGKSANQPWCNGSHKETYFKPLIFSSDEIKNIVICMCKHTQNPPYCDGSHVNL